MYFIIASGLLMYLTANSFQYKNRDVKWKTKDKSPGPCPFCRGAKIVVKFNFTFYSGLRYCEIQFTSWAVRGLKWNKKAVKGLVNDIFMRPFDIS